jgi:hypothetical protein
MDHASRRDLAVYLLYGALSIAFCSPLFAHPAGVGTLDWDQHFFYYAQVLKNVLEYAQPPFWSPWYCGGNVLWQNPQTALLSPVYPLTAVAGLPLAMKLNIVLHYWAGFIGMHLLLTRIAGVSFLPIVVYLASLFTLAGGHAMHVAVGHTVFLPAFYLPWLVYFLLRALHTRTIRPALYGGAVLALMIYNGGLHIVWMTVPAVAVFATALAVALRDWRPIAVAIVVGVSGAAYAAPKLLPVVLYVASDRFWDARDPTPRPDRMTAAMMLRAYADPSQDIGSKISASEQQHDWLEYGDYIGTLGAVLIAAALIWFLASAAAVGHLRPWTTGTEVHANRQLRALGVASAVTALFFFVWSAGEFSALAPAALLRHLPFLSSFRIPSRLTIIVVFFGGLAAAMFVRRIVDAIAWTTIARVAASMICAVAVLQLLVVNRAHFRDKFSASPLESGFRVLKGTGILVRDIFVNPYVANAPMLRALMNDQAVMWCYEVLQLKRGADAERPLVWTDGPAKISSVAFTPNRVQFSAIGGDARTRVFLNQNYAAGWRSDAGPVQLDPQAGGRMYVELAPGQTGRFAFAFSPPGLMTGVVGLMLAVAASAFAWRRRLP